MANLKLSGDTSGVITVAAPAAAGTNTLTLPATTGTLHDENSTLLSSNLSGALPAIDGSALTGISSGGMTLLTTLATTSGTTSTTATLNLSTYKNLVVYGWSVANSDTGGSKLRWGGNGGTQTGISNGNSDATNTAYFVLWHDLANKRVTQSTFFRYGTASQNTLAATGVGLVGVNNTITTSTTSIIFDWSGGHTFNLGSISIYGVA